MFVKYFFNQKIPSCVCVAYFFNAFKTQKYVFMLGF